MTRMMKKATLSRPIDAHRPSDSPLLRLPASIRPQTMPNQVLEQPPLAIAPMGYHHQAVASTGFLAHSATMASHFGIQQQLAAMQQQLTAMQQQLAADNSGYIVPSIPVSRQFLGPTVQGYQHFLPAQSLPARRETHPTPPLPQSRIPKAVPSVPASQQFCVSTAPGYQPFLLAQSLPARRANLPTPSLPRSRRIAKATRTLRATRTDQTRTPAQRAARQARFKQRLAVVNGIASPSKVPRGHRPVVPAPRKRRSDLIYPCARCAHRCAFRENVRSHFPACVERNGNPDGLRWDDAIKGIVEAPLGGLQDFELDGEDDEDWRLEDELQEDELRDVLEEMGWNNDEELEGDDAEHYRLENGSQEEEELRDILEEITPVDELARMDAIPIDPRLLEMANHAGGNLTVQDVLDQEFASMEENEMAALRPEDFESEDFELEWNF